MKKLILLMCLLCIAFGVNAQNNMGLTSNKPEHRRDSLPWSDKYLKQGNFMVMAEPTLTFDSWKVKENGQKNNNFSFDICTGYFPINRLAVGPEINYTHSKSHSGSGSTYSASQEKSLQYGLWARYYPEIGKGNSIVAPFQPYVSVDYSMGSSLNKSEYGTTSYEDKYKQHQMSAVLGADLPLCCHCAALNFYAGLDWGMRTNKDSSVPNRKESSSGFTAGLAFDVFFKNHHPCCGSY
ncbi:MAG: hypothetical protein WCO63_06275 [Bacteroidota bacterium]